MSSLKDIVDMLIGSVWDPAVDVVKVYDSRLPDLRNGDDDIISVGLKEVLSEINSHAGPKRKIRIQAIDGIQIIYIHWGGRSYPMNELQTINSRYNKGAEAMEKPEQGYMLTGYLIGKANGSVHIKNSDDGQYGACNIILLPSRIAEKSHSVNKEPKAMYKYI